MLEEISQYLSSGNNDVIAFLLMIVLSIGPLLLMWRSTYVGERTYDQYAPAASGMPASEQSRENQGNINPAAFTSAMNSQSIGEVPPRNNNSQSDINPEVISNLSANSQAPTEEETLPPANENDSSASAGHDNDFPTNDSTMSELLPGHFYIRLKFLDETVKVIQAKPSDTIGELKQKIFPRNLIGRYRMIFKGNVLRNNNQTLQDCGIRPVADASSANEMPVLHCFLSPTSDSQQGSASNSQTNLEELNVGHFFLPLFGCILSFLWYLCIFHTNLFTIPSLFGIVGLTCFFTVLLVNMLL